MTKQRIKTEIAILFDEGPDKFDSFHKERWGHSGFDESGRIKPRYMEALCTDYGIKEPFSNILVGMLKGDQFDETKERLNILFRAGLIDEHNELTPRGRYKTLSSLNFYNQIEELRLPVDQLDKLVPKTRAWHIEDAAKNIYSDRYEFVVRDEGTLFEFIESCFIYASRRYLIDNGFSPELLNATRGNPYRFVLAIRQGIHKGDLSTVKNIPGVRTSLLEKEDPKKNLSIVKKTVSEAIRDIKMEIILEDAKQKPGLTNRIRGNPLHCVEKAFNLLGEDTVRKIVACLFERPSNSNTGWSDLTVFHEGQYIPIEVKGFNDKLIYSQIERLFWLYDNIPEHATNQRIAIPPTR